MKKRTTNENIRLENQTNNTKNNKNNTKHLPYCPLSTHFRLAGIEPATS